MVRLKNEDRRLVAVQAEFLPVFSQLQPQSKNTDIAISRVAAVARHLRLLKLVDQRSLWVVLVGLRCS